MDKVYTKTYKRYIVQIKSDTGSWFDYKTSTSKKEAFAFFNFVKKEFTSQFRLIKVENVSTEEILA